MDVNHIVQHYCTPYFPDNTAIATRTKWQATAHGEAMPLHGGNVPAPDAPAKQPAEAAKANYAPFYPLVNCHIAMENYYF